MRYCYQTATFYLSCWDPEGGAHGNQKVCNLIDGLLSRWRYRTEIMVRGPIRDSLVVLRGTRDILEGGARVR